MTEVLSVFMPTPPPLWLAGRLIISVAFAHISSLSAGEHPL
jgi:hypothetical protein